VGQIEGDQERVAAHRQRAATEVDAPGVAASEDDSPRRVCRDMPIVKLAPLPPKLRCHIRFPAPSKRREAACVT
jgi:hypothetical protein